jgi:aspartate carbamoyltransferase catalytic subunit
MRHLLDVDELSSRQIDALMARAADFRAVVDAGGTPPAALAGRRVALLFAEPSTRTRLSFEIAARNLGAQTFVIDPGGSSLVKGESLADTARTLTALGVDLLVMRHHRAGAPWVAARYFGGTVVNAGDGWHAHPSQALLDLFTLRRHWSARTDGAAAALRGRKIVIVGDLRHSRVARSNMITLTAAGAEVWACGPAAWLRGWPGRRVSSELDAALAGADAVMALRVQKERMKGTSLELDAYVARYQLSEARLRQAAPGAVVLHPGPVNIGIELTAELASGPRSLILEQVHNGVPVRMAVLAELAANSGD